MVFFAAPIAAPWPRYQRPCNGDHHDANGANFHTHYLAMWIQGSHRNSHDFLVEYLQPNLAEQRVGFPQRRGKRKIHKV